MRALLAIAATVVMAAGIGCSGSDSSSLSTDESDVTGTTPNGLAQTVGLMLRGSGFQANCTGTLLGPRTIVSARHCFDDVDIARTGFYSPYPSGKGTTVHDVAAGVGTIKALSLAVHKDADLAVIQLSAPLGPSLGLPASGPYVSLADPPCGGKVSGDGAMSNGVFFASSPLSGEGETSRIENIGIEFSPCTSGSLIYAKQPGTGIPKGSKVWYEGGDSGGLAYKSGAPFDRPSTSVEAVGVLSSSSTGTATFTSLKYDIAWLKAQYKASEGTTPNW